MKTMYFLIIAFFLMSAEDGCEERLLIKNIYPNPVITELQVELEAALFEEYAQIDYQVVNMKGQVIASGKFENENNSINCSEFESGYYVIQLPQYGESTKFIKK